MDIAEKLLLPAIVALAGVIVYLWRRIEAYNATRDSELVKCRKERDAAWKRLASVEDSDPALGEELGS